MLITPEVADRLGVSTTRVRQLIWAGRLPSQQFGRDHLIKEYDLALVAERKYARPSNPKTYAEGLAAESQATEEKPSKKADKKSSSKKSRKSNQ